MHLKAWYWKACLLALTAAVLGFILRECLGWPEGFGRHNLEKEGLDPLLRHKIVAIEIRDVEFGDVDDVRIEDRKILDKLQEVAADVEVGKRAFVGTYGEITFYFKGGERAVGSFDCDSKEKILFIAHWVFDDPELWELLSKPLGIKEYVPGPTSEEILEAGRWFYAVAAIEIRDVEPGSGDVVRIEDREIIDKLRQRVAVAGQVAPMPFEGKIIYYHQRGKEIEGSFGYDPENRMFHIANGIVVDPELWELLAKVLGIKEYQPERSPDERREALHRLHKVPRSRYGGIVGIEFREVESASDAVRIEDTETGDKLGEGPAVAKQVAQMPFEGTIMFSRIGRGDRLKGPFGYDPEKKIFRIGDRLFDDPELWELLSKALDLKEAPNPPQEPEGPPPLGRELGAERPGHRGQ